MPGCGAETDQSISLLAAEELLASVYDTVPHGFDVFKGRKHSVFRIQKSVKYDLDTHSMVRNRHFLHIFLFSGCLMLDASGIHTDSFDKAFSHQIEHFITFHIEKLILQG